MRIFGIPIKIEVSFFVLTVFLALGRAAEPLLIMEWVVVVFFSILQDNRCSWVKSHSSAIARYFITSLTKVESALFCKVLLFGNSPCRSQAKTA